MGFLILDLYEKLGGNAELFYFTMKTSNHNDTPSVVLRRGKKKPIARSPSSFHQPVTRRYHFDEALAALNQQVYGERVAGLLRVTLAQKKRAIQMIWMARSLAPREGFEPPTR